MIDAKLQTVLSKIDKTALPGIFAYLSELPEEDYYHPYTIATMILSLDKPKDLPDYLIRFVTEIFLHEIDERNDDAMNDLGAQYYDGNRGFEQNFQKAVHYYSMAAENGNRQAQENLGYCYYYGRDGKPDYEKAFHYFALGAFDGHLISLYKIGDMYLNGLYVPKNEHEAFYIYMRCIQTMTEETEGRVAGPVYLRLGRMFLDGMGTEQNLKNALVCFQRAENYLYDMVMAGDVMYRRSLEDAVAGCERTREKLAEKLPEKTWVYDG